MMLRSLSTMKSRYSVLLLVMIFLLSGAHRRLSGVIRVKVSEEEETRHSGK